MQSMLLQPPRYHQIFPHKIIDACSIILVKQASGHRNPMACCPDQESAITSLANRDECQ